MKIRKLTLFTNQLNSEKILYNTILGFDLLSDNKQSFTVRVGWTELSFVESKQKHIYHYCFLIPANKLIEALNWFEQRIDIFEISKGQKTQHFESWNADSFYFFDGSGNLAECIVRYDLQNQSESTFDQKSLLGINEIGLPTTDISKTDAKLSKLIGTQFWKGDFERFGTHGNQEGLFLLPNYEVKDKWFPTNIQIRPEPFEVLIEHNESYYLRFSKDGNEIKVVDI